MKDLHRTFVKAALCLALVASAGAQTSPTNHIDMVYSHDTGLVQNLGQRADVTASFTVEVSGTHWLRLYFSKAILPRGTEVRISSWADGDVQILTGQNMAQWQNTSCYLNGDKLQVEIFAEVWADPARLVLAEVDAGLAQPPGSICGSSDDRVASSDSRAARMLPIGCTGWLFEDCSGCFMTAGHCGGGLSVAQFNVPASSASGALVNPPASDQYAVDAASIQSNGGLGVGNDWAVFGCFDNATSGLQASAVQGPGYTLAASMPVTGMATRITGYGTDGGSANQTQQTHVGPLVDNSGTQLGYVTDTTGGNSGSPVIHEASGNAIGIHTHGGCSASGGNNWGTQVTRSDIQTAIANPQGICSTNCGGGGGGGGGCTADAFSPNHSCGAAAPLTDGVYGLEVCKTEPDFFSFTVADGATLDASVLHSVTVADLDVMLYEAINCSDDQGSGCGATLACGFTGSDNETISWTNTTGADVDCIVRVHVWPSSTGDASPYDLNITGIGGGGGGGGCTADAFSPNHSCAAAATVSDGAYGLEVCKTEPDFFSFTVAAGATLDATVGYLVADADIDVMLYEAVNCSDDQSSGCAATLGCGFTGSDDEVISWTNASAVDVDCIMRVHVWPSSAGDAAPYVLSITGTGPGGGGGGGCTPDAFSPNHSCAASAVLVDGNYALEVCKTEPDFFSFTVANGATWTADILHSTATADIDAMLYEAVNCDDDQSSGCNATLTCGFTGSDDENLTWTNTSGADMDCILRVHVWPNSGGDAGPYDLVVAGIGGGGSPITSFCDPASPNTTGSPAVLTGSLSPAGLHMEVNQGPVGQFGFFLLSAGSHAGVPVSSGILCLSTPIGRYNAAAGGVRNSLGQFQAGGFLVNLVGTSVSGTGFDVPSLLPNPPGGTIVGGSTWMFQLWFRDGANSNFSNGIEVTF